MLWSRAAVLSRRSALERSAPVLALKQDKYTSANPGAYLSARVCANASAELSEPTGANVNPGAWRKRQGL